MSAGRRVAVVFLCLGVTGSAAACEEACYWQMPPIGAAGGYWTCLPSSAADWCNAAGDWCTEGTGGCTGGGTPGPLHDTP
jgi:hypothetical protein